MLSIILIITTRNKRVKYGIEQRATHCNIVTTCSKINIFLSLVIKIYRKMETCKNKSQTSNLRRVGVIQEIGIGLLDCFYAK